MDRYLDVLRGFAAVFNSIEKQARSSFADFVAQVLEVEHRIIAPLVRKAHLVVGKDYEVVKGGRGLER